MATSGDDIQIDKGGFVRVHYAIFELLAKAPLRGQQFRCLMFLFRMTYGYNKKEDKISLAQWADGAGMERHNVWRELQILIRYNIIYMKKNGPKQANTYGFNKHHEEWNIPSVVTDDYTSVVTDDNNNVESVVKDDYKEDETVVKHDYKSVVTPHEQTKDNKAKQSSLPAADDEDGDDARALVRLAYQAVNRIGPPMSGDAGKANLITACDLIERFTYTNCIRALTTLKERNNTMIKKNTRDAIRSPVGYLRTIMDDEHGTSVSTPKPATVDFAYEDVRQ